MYETYSRSRIHEAYPQLRAHAFKHWDRIFGSWSHSTDRRPLVLYVSVDLFFRTQDSETRICVGVPRRFPTLFHNKKKADKYKVYSCNRIPERDLFLLV